MKAAFAILMVFFLAIAGTAFYYIKQDRLPQNLGIFSPLPDNGQSGFQLKGVTEIWKPNLAEQAQADSPEPELTATAALTYDLNSEQLIYEKNIKKRLPMASLTKIMTAIVALESDPLDKKITITKDAATVGENAMGLTEGEKLTVEELLYGLMLPSGNDAAEALAQGSSIGRKGYVTMMNKKAEDLGLSDTNFTNPSGLEGDGKQYTTAVDLLVMSKYGLSNPDFARIVSTYQKDLPYTSDHKAYTLYNETNLLTTYPGVKGIKIGFTWEAGHCLVTYLDYKGHKIIGVILNSQNRRDEMKQLLDYSLKSLGETPPVHD